MDAKLTSRDAKLTSCFRAAIASGQFEMARALWENYAEQLCAELRAGPVAPNRLAETQELVEWCRLATLAARAHASDLLSALAAGERYSMPAGAAPHNRRRLIYG